MIASGGLSPRSQDDSSSPGSGPSSLLPSPDSSGNLSDKGNGFGECIQGPVGKFFKGLYARSSRNFF